MGKDGHLCDNTTFRWYSLASCSTTGAGLERHRAEHRTSSRYYSRNRILGKMCKSLLLDLRERKPNAAPQDVKEK